MATFTLHGVTIEVPKGGRSAKASRPAIYLDGELVQTAAAAEFAVIPEGPSPQVQATRWALSLPRIEQAAAKVTEATPVEALPDTDLDEVHDGE